MKKALATWLAFAAVLFSLAGCEPETDDPSDENISNEQTKDMDGDEKASEERGNNSNEEDCPDETELPDETLKPVIYLYPEYPTDVTVELTYAGTLTCSYPAYENGWTVSASPDGTLTDSRGTTYNYLYWEGVTNAEYDFSTGFCIPGEDTAEFLEEALAALGLNRREANEFIVYWLPLMESNAYNLISFQTDAYTELAALTVMPSPDTILRVFMAWKPLDEQTEITPQELVAPTRDGFVLVEWGGGQVK